MKFMSLTKQSESLGLSDELRDIFFLLLKKSPLTLGELCFLTKNSEDKVKTNIKSLIESGFVREIDDIIPLYIALYPTLLLKTNLETFLNEIKDFEINFNKKNKTNLDELLKSVESSKVEFKEKISEIMKNYDTNHSVSIQQLENQSQNLIKTSTQAQTDTF